MDSIETTLVIGHRNPDTDTIASAVGYAWLLNKLGGGKFTAGRAGKVNAQTAFALERCKVDMPALVVDVWPRVGDLTEALPTLRQGQTLLEACQSIARTRRPAPLLDADKKPIGLLTGAGLFANLADALSSTSVLALAKEFDRPAATAIDHATVTLGDDEHIRDVLGKVLRSEQDDFLVVDEADRYVGLCRKSALLAPPRRRIIIVDHNEPTQAVPGIEEAELIEVLDHHRLGNLPTVMPIRFRVEPVGSCSTLVAEQGIESDTDFPAPIASLLLCGILSDTLIFRSPTTTPRDERAADRLAVMAGLGADGADRKAAMAQLGQELLAAGAGLGTRPADEITSSDLKFYESNGMRVGMAQVEVASFVELGLRLPELRTSLQTLATSQNLALALLMVTDIVMGNSRLLAIGDPRIVTALPYARLDDGTLDAPDVVSRKKQLLPAVLSTFSELA